MGAQTLAGTRIDSQADVFYSLGDSFREASSNPVGFVVDQLVEIEVLLDDESELVVVPGSESEVLAFRVSNLGNGLDSFTIDSINSSTEDDFDLANLKLFVDSNQSGSFEEGVDSELIAHESTIELEAYESVDVFLIGDVPQPLADGQYAANRIDAYSTKTLESNEGSGNSGTELDTVDIVFSSTEGRSGSEGIVRIQFVEITIVKNIDIENALGTSEAITGAIVTCYLDVAAVGSTTAQRVIVEDVVPVEATYIASSLTLNQTGLSDQIDSDAGAVSSAVDESVIRVYLSSVGPSTPVQRISYKMMIN